MDEREHLVGVLRWQAVGCRSMGSAFYGELLDQMAVDVERGGPAWELLAQHAAEPFERVFPLRVLGGVHRLVLCGAAPELARRYPTTGGDGDATAAWPAFAALLGTRPVSVLDALRRPPQTNEVGRAASLVGGLLAVAAETGLPLRLLEVGASAGLNLRLDRYWYQQGGSGWGDPASPVRFIDLWDGGSLAWGARAEVAERRGCDRDPLDATDDDTRLTLLSWVWPGQDARFELLRRALDVAGEVPVAVDEADLVDWLPDQLHQRADGVATVVFHSIVWPYLSDEARAEVRGALETAGAAATDGSPLAWLRLEAAPSMWPAEVRLTTWPGGSERLLATAGFHVGAIHWLI